MYMMPINKGGAGMMEKERVYLAIDLKSFYASVECVERQLDPMRTNLVVADASRTEKTICLAVSPSLKSFGISGRARLFEVVQKVKEVNLQRKACAPGINSRGNPIFPMNCLRTRSFPYPISSPRPAWHITWNTALRFTKFIFSILRRKISTYTRSMKSLWMSRHI